MTSFDICSFQYFDNTVLSLISLSVQLKMSFLNYTLNTAALQSCIELLVSVSLYVFIDVCVEHIHLYKGQHLNIINYM